MLAARGGLKGAAFCARHPLLCTGGVVAGLAAGGAVIHHLGKTDNGGKKRCPPVVPEPEAMKEDARAYQRFVTGLPDNTTIWLDGTKFDGCRESDGTLLEAKGNYDVLLEKRADYKHLKKFLPPDTNTIFKQGVTQASIARSHGLNLEWHFMQKASHTYWKRVFSENTLTDNIKVIYHPFPQEQAGASED